MLRVTTIHARSAASSARYYTRYLTGDGPDADGHWVGQRAPTLGVFGVVQTEDLEALLSGFDPTTGRQLGSALVDRVDHKGNTIKAVAGYDATFSAPKSLSVWWGLTNDPGLLDAHNLAVQAVLDHLERYGATTRIRVDDKRQHPDVGGLVMAVFPQATSREDDPQLHTHVVVSAKVLAPDGRWLALDGHYIKKKQRALGGLYQSVLRAELTAHYGVAWRPIVDGQAEIVGMPEELLAAFSKRTAQVDKALAAKVKDFRARRGRDPTRCERAALTREAAQDSRTSKSHVAPGDLNAHWRDQAEALGWTPQRLVREMRRAAERARAPELPTVASIVDQLSGHGSTWSRADVLQAVCDQTPPVAGMPGAQWAAAVERACDRVVEACTTLDDPAPLMRRTSDGRSIWVAPVEPHLTTEGVLTQEERILAFAIEANGAPPTPSLTIDRSGLDVLQVDAAAAVAGRDALVLVVGPAGTGKTTTLRAAADNLRAQGRDVFAVAPTAKAAKVLRDGTGIPAETVAKLLYEWREGAPRVEFRLRRGTTLICDEAGMVGTGSLDRLVDLASEQRWRIVLVGDPRQLQAVGRGGMFDELCRAARTHELATIHRFRHDWEQSASLQLRRGDPAALDAYFAHRRVSGDTFDALVERVADDWIAHRTARRTVAVVAETNEHVDTLNAAVQERRRVLGHLGGRSVRIGGGESVSVGEIVVTRRNDRTVRTDRGEPVRNRDRWTVTAIGRDGSLTVTHDHGHGHVTLPADYARQHLRLGYAATAHGHQGDTVDVSLAIVTAATTHRSLYVGATRGRLENRLLVVTEEPDRVRDVLEQVLTNERADIPAVAQRRHLARQEPPSTRAAVEESVHAARKALRDAMTFARPYLQAVAEVDEEVDALSEALSDARRDLHDRAEALIAQVGDLGLRPGSIVAVGGRTSVATLTAILATWLAGATLTVLPHRARGQTTASYRQALEGRLSNSAASLVLGDGAIAESLPSFRWRNLGLTLAAETHLDAPDRGRTAAITQSTSGSTGNPQRLDVLDEQLMWNVGAIADVADLTTDDVFVSWLPLAHDMGLIAFFALPLALGSSLTITDASNFARRPALWMDMISSDKATVTGAPHFAFELVARRPPQGDLSELRVALNGAELIRPQGVRDFVEATRRCGLDPLAVRCSYGLAEVTLAATIPRSGGLVVDSVDPGMLSQRLRRPGEHEFAILGEALPGSRVEIDCRSDEDVGEIVIVSPSAVSEDARVRTGDLGYMTERGLVVCGRSKDVIIVGGINLHPEPLELAACAVEGVRRGNVVAFGTRAGMTESVVIVAEVAEGASIRKDDVVRAVREACGVTVGFVVLTSPGALPKTTSGKLQRARCRQLLEDGSLESM